MVKRREVAPLDHPLHEDTQPALDLIEPGCILGQIHQLNTVAQVAQKGGPTRHRRKDAGFPLLAQVLRDGAALRNQPYQLFRLRYADDAEWRVLSSERSLVHDELIAMTGLVERSGMYAYGPELLATLPAPTRSNRNSA